MASTLVQGKAHDLKLLALFTHSEGIAADAHLVEYVVMDDSAGLPGVQVLPAAGRTDVTATDGRFATGSYGVWNPLTAAAWAPADAIARGRVVWYYKMSADDEERVVERPFEVLAQAFATRGTTGLALVQDVKDFGGIAAALTNGVIHTELNIARDVIERVCRQRFRPIVESKRFRGDETDLLHLDEPLVALSTITAYDATTPNEMDLSTLRVFVEGEDRRNPKIEMAREKFSIFTPTSLSLFAEGVVYAIAGTWGFVEPDTLAAPDLIRRAAVQWVRITLGERGGASRPVAGRRIRSESTDRHSIAYGDAPVAASRPALTSILRDPVVADALALYKAPLALGRP